VAVDCKAHVLLKSTHTLGCLHARSRQLIEGAENIVPDNASHPRQASSTTFMVAGDSSELRVAESWLPARSEDLVQFPYFL
jgi:hypothetical protein